MLASQCSSFLFSTARSGVKWVIRTDKYQEIKFCFLQSMTADPHVKLCGVEKVDVLGGFIFVEGLCEYHISSTAVLSYLPTPYSALSYLLIIPTPLRDAVYDFVAKRCYKWCGKERDCRVLQEPEMLDRFVDKQEILEPCQCDNNI